MAVNPFPVQQSNRKLTILAWIVTVLISTVPEIILMETTGTIPAWLVYAKMGLLLGFMVCVLVFKPLRPLRNFFIVMFVFFGLAELRLKFNFTLPVLQKLFGSTVFDARMQAEQTGKLVISIVMILVLLALVYKRKNAFLTAGALRAPIAPVRLLGFPKADPWPRFGLQWGTYIAVALAVALFLGLKPGSEVMLKVLPILPSILFYAALNAFNEEVTYRVPMLTTLEPVAGSTHSLWMAAGFFGIAHYFGTPGGILGGLLSIFMGWILGKAMLETRGLFWTWWIHFLSDVAIYVFLTAGLLM
jgi:hypothetical protein